MTPIYLQRTCAFMCDKSCHFRRWSYVVMSFDGTEFSLS